VAQRHRGPDGQGQAEIQLSWARVTLGMTRLKIVDQREIPVPFRFPYLGVSLAYNGEIYNLDELRQVLSGDDPWLTQCDAEVLARAWKAWGVDCLTRLNGMWAFILVDEHEERVFAARDRAGEKPLYRAAGGHPGEILLASTVCGLKGLGVSLQETSCPDMDCLEFDFRGSTPLAGIRRVLPGHSLLLSSQDRRGEETPWWELPVAREPGDCLSFSQAVLLLEDILQDAVRARARAEVPVGIMLSGGLDSALIYQVCRMQGIPVQGLYCVDFPGEIDNLSLARAAAQGAEVIPVRFSRDEMLEALPSIARHLDTPATWTACCQWFLFQRMRSDGIKVALSGEGADELFGGYARYRDLYWEQRKEMDPHLAEYRPLIQRTHGDPWAWMTRMLNRGGDRTECLARELLVKYGGASIHQGDFISGMARTDFHTTMQVLLRMADRMAMAWSIENRSPFLDYRLLELSPRISWQAKITSVESKHVLREVARRLGVPREIVEEKTKRGLALPSSWTRATNGSGLGHQTSTSTPTWDRSWFRDRMLSAWRSGLTSRDGNVDSREPSGYHGDRLREEIP